MLYLLLPIDWASHIPGFWLVLQTCLIQTSRKLGAVSLLTDEQMHITWDLHNISLLLHFTTDYTLYDCVCDK